MKTYTQNLKIIFSILLSIFLFNHTLLAQAPDGMTYQAVVRDVDDNLLSNSSIGMQISILEGSDTGSPVYVETHTTLSNANGLVSLEIGSGSLVSGDFSTIDWSNGSYFIKTETDPDGGSNYTITGTSQLLSVPYALYATSSGESLPYTSGDGISIIGNEITNTSPDQTVLLNGSGATSIIGTYPSFTINSTDEINDADADPNNELQILSKSGSTVSLSNGGGSFTDEVNDADANATNEIQDISLSGNNLSISDGSSVDLSGISPSGAWSTSGNSGTDESLDFIGTTDGQALVFKVNNLSAGRIDNTVTNTSFGYLSNQSYNGVLNSSFGNKALQNNTSGIDNSAFGANSMRSTNTGNWNTAVGSASMMVNTTGSSNAALGYATLIDNTTGGANTAIGALALTNNTSGDNNTAIGDGAMLTNTTGSSNTSLGIQALFFNTSASSNVAIGRQALYNSQDASEQVAVGGEALYSNTSGLGNTAVGFRSLYSNTNNNNSALGYKALMDNTLGNDNTAIGNLALNSNTTADNNTAVGVLSLSSNIGGGNNTAIGKSALSANTSNSNTAIGFNSLKDNTMGYQNTSIGANSLTNSISGKWNVAIGYNNLLGNTTGSSNIAIGADALIANTTGAGNVVIGDLAGSTGNYSNRIAIGETTQNSASNQTRIGNTNMLSIGGQVGWTTVSDGRFKTNINENVEGLSFILKLRPVTYFLDKKAIENAIPGSKRENAGTEKSTPILQTGFIAQEVEESAQSLGYDFSGVDAPKNENDYYGLRYAEFVVPLVKATQEQQVLIEEEQIKNENLNKLLENQQQEINELKALITQMLNQ